MTDRTDEREVESFASMFSTGYGVQPDRIEKRMKAEKRSALTDKQRKRGAVRTAQINYRCTPAYKALAAGLAKHCNVSIADVMEEALAMLANTKKFKGGE